MTRTLATAFLVVLWFPVSPGDAQEIFSDTFEDASICAWSNADHTNFDDDGYSVCQFDCDDERSDVYPGANDACGDGIDNDCTGFADEVCCHPLLQDCPASESCYYILTTHAFFCAAPFGMPPGQQEETCQFQNACAEGFGCTLCIPPDCNGEDFVCAAFCDPNGSDCATGETCLLYDDFWSDVDPAPDDFGMCVPNEILP